MMLRRAISIVVSVVGVALLSAMASNSLQQPIINRNVIAVAESASPTPVKNSPESLVQPNDASSEEAPCLRLAKDYRYRPMLNGIKLPVPPEEEEASISDAKIKPISHKSLLVMMGNTLYRLDAAKRIVWKYTEGQFMFDFAFIPATGLIYGTAGDGVMFILDATSGKRLVRDAYMGKGAYGVVRAYGKDQCLVTSDFAMYREDWNRLNLDLRSIKDFSTSNDEVTAFRGTKALWTRSFPPDADLMVDGKRILAVTKTESTIYVKEMAVPRRLISR
jgi:hypothetical protein